MTQRTLARRILVVVPVLAASAVAVWAFRPTDAAQADGALDVERSAVTASMRRGPLATSLQLPGTYSFDHPVDVVVPPNTSGAGTRQLISRAPAAVGERVAGGTTLAEINYRPMIVVPGALPLYRDIRPGTAGPDVRAFQAGLEAIGFAIPGSEIGTFGPASQRAVDAMYRLNGYGADYTSGSAAAASAAISAAQRDAASARAALNAAAGRGEDTTALRAAYRLASDNAARVAASEGVMVVASMVVTIPAKQMVIAKRAVSPGALVEPGAALATLANGAPLLNARVSVVQARQLPPDALAQVSGLNTTCRIGTPQQAAPASPTTTAPADDPGATTVPNGNVVSGDNAAAPSNGDLVAPVTCDPAPTLDVVGTDVVVTANFELGGADSFVVPATAVAYDDDGTASVMTADGSARKRLTVTVVAESDGFVALSASDGLRDGEQVVVSR